MSAAIEYAGIPIDGSASSTRALAARLAVTARRLARRTATPPPPAPDDEECPELPPVVIADE